MRNLQDFRAEAFDIVEAPVETEQHVARGTVSVPDMPAAAGVMLVAVYAAVMAALAVVFAGDGRSIMTIVIGAFFVAMFFAVPTVFLRFEGDQSRRPSLERFLESGIATATGRLGGRDALVQMLIVPGLLALAILAMGVIRQVV